jgi:hypothetical protein
MIYRPRSFLSTYRRAYQPFLPAAGARMLDICAGLTTDERARLCTLFKKFIAALDARDA